MDWKDYEEITKQVYQVLGENNGVHIKCYGSECKVEGKSGVEHQIDVLTEHSDGLHTYLTAVECKYWNKNINKDIIMKVAEIVEDTSLNKGVIVSKLGFTPDAVRFAKYKNIGLIELRELTDDDWKGRIKDIVVNINVIMPELTGFQIIMSEDVSTDLKPGKTRVDSLAIQQANGERKPLKTFIDEFILELGDKEENEEFHKTYNLASDSKLINLPTDSEIPIHGFRLSGILHIGKSTTEIKGKDHIWMIMKSIFENRTYTISKNGEIRERSEK